MKQASHLNVWIPEALGERVEKLAVKTGMTKTKIITEAVDLYTLQFKEVYPDVIYNRVSG